MAINSYFQIGILSVSNFRFAAIEYERSDEISGEIRMDMLENLVGVRGFNFVVDSLMVKMRRTVRVGSFGNQADYRSIVLYKGPIVYVDFDGTSHTGFVLPGRTSTKAVSTILEGTSALVLSPLSIIFKA